WIWRSAPKRPTRRTPRRWPSWSSPRCRPPTRRRRSCRRTSSDRSARWAGWAAACRDSGFERPGNEQHEHDGRTRGRPVRREARRAVLDVYEGVVQDLIDELGRLPNIGPKSAQRIAFHVLQADPVDVKRLAEVLIRVKETVRFCEVCGNVASAERCRICLDPRRDPSVLCVVEEPKDVVAIERTREFRGRYHVLGGAISPIDGVGPDDLRIRE